MHGWGKEQESKQRFLKYIKNSETYHQASAARHIVVVLFLGFCGAVATAGPRRLDQHWFPDWSAQCRSKCWQYWKRRTLLHVNHTCTAELAVFAATFRWLLSNIAAQTELQPSLQVPETGEFHFLIIVIHQHFWVTGSKTGNASNTYL